MATPAAPPSAAGAFPLPTILTHPSSTDPTLIAQGAEGRLYKTTYLSPDTPCALKYRPAKPWRHPTLDQRLTRHRILSEARILVRCRREGVRVPAVYGLDEAAGWLMLEWVSGLPVRARINEALGARAGGADGVERESVEDNEALRGLMRRIGAAVGHMHRVGVVHGDLTTSNMMLSPTGAETGSGAGGAPLDGDIVIIDLGLASGSTLPEDRAVDLYVLERAFASTHPRAECIFPDVLEAYKESFPQAPAVIKRLEDVRMRGRKRSMLG
ncbi:TP53 regulating kinase [Geosmithia morbida]|uniref:EKC/KEOPS complex subunit BUD32 n=1 Tax=Geosmithia morbida TaxID=1094350 RepID=A0A9P4YW84_9HYPO|nr:TP53 regulating kinase [Geosmithia morbida]KAF4124253.1 TP53 regulating kinase [Geosmithia morbida]